LNGLCKLSWPDAGKPCRIAGSRGGPPMESPARRTTDDKLLYNPPDDPVLIEVPPFEFVLIDGSGDPNTSPDFQAAVGALYSYSYPVVMTMKKAGWSQLKVRPLEGLWWAEDLSVFDPRTSNRSAW